MTLNLAGRRFGKLVVISLVPEQSSKNRRWRCLCDCGHECTPQTSNLTSGNSTACGSCRVPSFGALRHGYSRAGLQTPTYRSWKAMKERVKSKKGYVGIYLDPLWRDDFAAFLADMGERPDGRTIDRIDGSKGYFKENCRWATPTEQTRNRRTTRRFTIGTETKTVAEWATVAGISYGAAEHRLVKYGGVELPDAVRL